MRFEQVRACFEKSPVVDAARPPQKNTPVRVVEFRTASEYDAFKLRPNADAYYSAAGDRNYIVMSMFAKDDFSIVGHEYAHFLLHSGGMKLPRWLNEGLAELFSTLKVTSQQCEVGGPIPVRVETLRRSRWLPASELFAAHASDRETRAGQGVFYAESWALADMLLSAPEYAPRFRELVEVLNGGLLSQRALNKLYGKSPEAILNDAREWIHRGASSTKRTPPPAGEVFKIEVDPLQESEAQALIADLLLTNGDWDRAEQIYKELLLHSPRDPDLLASLGTVALRKGEATRAVEYWHKAMDAGLKDAQLCYRYAVLSDQFNFPSGEIEQALDRAVAIEQNFDDARYKLAQLKSNAGEYAAAVTQLQAIKEVLPGRAFAYWTSLAYALTELGSRDEAEAAAEHAKQFAADSGEYARAAELCFRAKTDMSVRYARDAEGKLQLVTTRVPHGTTRDNPFIQPEDRIQIASGPLEEVQCSDGKLTGFLVKSNAGTLALSVPDPTHVLIRNGPSEFYCGPQGPVDVEVEYATTEKAGHGLLRGLGFKQGWGSPVQ